MELTDKGTLVSLEIGQWSGKAKLSRNELPDEAAANMPPEALASLGSKKLLDPSKLKVFGMLRTRAVRLMESSGVRLLGGYYVSNDRVADVDSKLAGIADDWRRAVDGFISTFDTDVDEWCRKYPEWENSIRSALPSSANVRNRFLFNWHAFRITPSDDAVQAKANTEASVSEVSVTALDEVAKLAKSIFETTFADRSTKASGRTFNCLSDLYDKVSSAGFVNGDLRVLARCVDKVRTDVAELVHQGDADRCVEPVSNLLIAISTPEGIRAKMSMLSDDSDDDEITAGAVSLLRKDEPPVVQQVVEDTGFIDGHFMGPDFEAANEAVDELVHEANVALGKEEPAPVQTNLTELLDEEDLW